MKRQFLMTVLCLLTGVAYSQNLIGYYKFTGNAQDSSGKGYHGTVNGTVSLVPDRFGKPNSAYSFDGSTGYIDITNTAFKLSTYTHSAWIYMDVDPTEAGAILAMGDTTAEQSELVYMDGLNTKFGLGLISSNSDKSKVTFAPFGKPAENRRWYHITVTRSNSKLNFYVDGSLMKSANLMKAAGYGTDFKSYIGMRYSGLHYFNGIIDDVRIYDAAMTATQVADLHNSEIPANKQIAYYPFTGNAADSGGLGLNGTPLTASLTTDRFGRANRAYSFTGTSSRIDISYQNFRLNRYTYSAWVSVGANPGATKYMSILSIGNSATDQGILLGNDASGFVGFGVAAVSTDLSSPVVAGSGVLPDLGVWQHVVVTRDDNSVALYLDGKPVSSGSVAGKHPAYGSDQKGYIGMRTSLLQYFKGSIDDVRIFNYALTAQDVKNMYNQEVKLDTGGGGGQTGLAEDAEALMAIGIYPNPVTAGTVTINTNQDHTNMTLMITDLQGKLVQEVKLIEKETRITSLSRGCYFFNISDSNHSTVRKVIVTD